jgi:CheY-like chemotaxis protein
MYCSSPTPGISSRTEDIRHEARRTPAQLIASSGYANDPVMARYREYRFDGVLAKPCSFTELTSVLASLAEQPSILGTNL